MAQSFINAGKSERTSLIAELQAIVKRRETWQPPQPKSPETIASPMRAGPVWSVPTRSPVSPVAAVGGTVEPLDIAGGTVAMDQLPLHLRMQMKRQSFSGPGGS